jgi:pilus assembly protein Flp/PilA
MVLDFLAKDEGQGLVEYGLILVLIMVVVVAVITVFGGKVNTMFSSVNSGFG